MGFFSPFGNGGHVFGLVAFCARTLILAPYMQSVVELYLTVVCTTVHPSGGNQTPSLAGIHNHSLLCEERLVHRK